MQKLNGKTRYKQFSVPVSCIFHLLNYYLICLSYMLSHLSIIINKLLSEKKIVYWVSVAWMNYVIISQIKQQRPRADVKHHNSLRVLLVIISRLNKKKEFRSFFRKLLSACEGQLSCLTQAMWTSMNQNQEEEKEIQKAWNSKSIQASYGSGTFGKGWDDDFE